MELNEQVKSVRDEIVQTVQDYKAYAQKQIDEIKQNGVANPETKEALDRVVKRMDGLEAMFHRPGGNDGMVPLSKTLGEIFIESEAFKGFQTRGWHKGGVAIKVKSFFETKTTITSSAVGSSTPGILVPERVPGIISPQLRALRVRDLLARTTTTQSAIEFVKENVFTNAASPQVEASNKAESALTFTIASVPVRTIAHWIPATRQVLDDLSQLQNYINTRMLYGLKYVEDNQLLNGDGTGVNIDGLIHQATAYNTGYNVASDTKIDKLRHAIKQARIAEYPVDGIVVNPADWEVMELTKTEEGGANKGQYILGGPASMATPTLWGKPIVETNAIASGTFLVGSFSLGAEIYDREDAAIDVSTEHSDYFIKNMVAIRAEERLALAVYRPAAFITGSY